MLLKEGFALHSSLEMKNSGRRQVKTPVGNKTKRGAELEGTPKTPRSFEVSPCKSTCVEGFSQEPEDRRVEVKSRRPLQWNKLTKQGIDAMAAEDSFENTLQSPFLHRDLKSKGESEAVAALSPICVNALNTDQQGGRINAAIKNPNEMMSPSLALVTMKGCCDSCSKDQGYGRTPEEAQKNANDDHDQRTPVDSGSCHSSPECQISALTGERIFLWSNAAFCQRPAHEETVSSRKGMATSASCSSSGSSARHKAAITERADCEAESKATDQDSLPKTDGDQRHVVDGSQRESPVVDGRHGIGSSNQETKLPGIRVERTKLSDSSMARELLFEYDKCCSGGLILEPDHGTSPYLVQQRSDTNERTGVRKRVLHAGQAVGNADERVEIGLEEIEKEIQRLTERLTELRLQKRTREEEMRRHIGETTSHAGSKQATDQDQMSGVTVIPPERRGKQSVGTGAKIGKRVVSVSSSTGSMLQSPGRPCHEVVLKPNLETPGSRQGHCRRTSKASKLSELRRSVSSASRRTECSRRSSDAEAERSKVLRRLSMSESMTSSPSNVLLHSQQRLPRSFPGKGSSTPNSRVVSSRYGRALTPDACRPSGGGSTVACRNRDRPSSAASSPLPQPPAALASSPFKRVATLRSGYPSRSGFVTPTKERQQLVSLSATRTSSPDASAPSSSTSSLRAQKMGRGRLLYSPSKSSLIARVDSPKSTAALYKCLESLLEDSKHFFKHLSPARSRLHTHLLPPQQQQQQVATTPCNTLQEPTLPNINTCRVNAISPRDSGCVKRECDRQKKRFFFATEEQSQRHDSTNGY